jgi:hypothetical protein
MCPVRFLCATNLADQSRHRRAVGFSFHGRRGLTEQLEPQLPTCCFASPPDTTSDLPPLTGPPSRLRRHPTRFLNARRWRIYDKSSCWRPDRSLQHTLLVADDTAGTSLQPTTTSYTHAPLRCARRNHCTHQLLQLGTTDRDNRSGLQISAVPAVSVVRRAQLTSRPALQSAASLALQSAHRYDGHQPS